MHAPRLAHGSSVRLPGGWVLALSLVALLAVTGCQATSPAPGPGSGTPGDPVVLQGRWQAVHAEGFALLPGVEVVIGFEGTRISAHAGCNSMGGEFTATDQILQVPRLMSTRMACEGRMEQEAWVSKLLGDQPHWQVTGSGTGETLVLQAGDRKLGLQRRPA